MPCVISNGARKAAEAHGMDVEAIANRHTGSYLSVDDVMRAARASTNLTHSAHVLGSGTVATYPAASRKRIRLPGGSCPAAHKRRCAQPASTKSVPAVAPAAVGSSAWPPDAGLQPRVDAVLAAVWGAAAENVLAADALNVLLADLAAAGETDALVRVWDRLGGAHHATERTWRALERLHECGKGRVPRGTLVLPAESARKLTPERRLHKICKGRVTSRRSAAAAIQLPAALEWLEAQRAAGRQSFLSGREGPARSALANELRRALGVDKEAARGLVTKLRQTGRL